MSTEKGFSGSCHCGFIKYTAKVSEETLSKHTATRCNCKLCQKTGFTNIPLKPEDFTLISPWSTSELATYPREFKMIRHYFCSTCGVQIYGQGAYEYEGKRHEFFNINLLTLDQPQEGLDLSEFKMKYYDGLHDNWMGGEKEVPWTGGSV